MEFYKIYICQFIILSLYIVYKKHDDDKNWPSKKEENCKHYRKSSNYFAANCIKTSCSRLKEAGSGLIVYEKQPCTVIVTGTVKSVVGDMFCKFPVKFL